VRGKHSEEHFVSRDLRVANLEKKLEKGQVGREKGGKTRRGGKA